MAEETVPREEAYLRDGESVDQTVDGRALPSRRKSILLYLTNFFRCIKTIRVIFFFLYPGIVLPPHPPGQCGSNWHTLPSKGCEEEHLQHAKTQAERLSMIALFLRTMETIRSLDQAYNTNQKRFKNEVRKLKEHFRHGLAYLNFMILGVLNRRSITEIQDLLSVVVEHDGKCDVCSFEVDSLRITMDMPTMILLSSITHTCERCSRELSLKKLRNSLTIDLKTVSKNPKVVQSCQHCEDMLLDIFFHTELISFVNCTKRMMASLQIILNPAAIHSQDFKKKNTKMKELHYYSPSIGVYEALFLSGWKEKEKEDEKDTLMKFLFKERRLRAFIIKQTLEEGERGCCEEYVLQNVRKMPEFILKNCTSVRLVLESTPCQNCAKDVLPKMRDYIHGILPTTKRIIRYQISAYLHTPIPRHVPTSYVREISIFTAYALLEYMPGSTYPDRLYARILHNHDHRLKGGTILLRDGSDYDKRFACLWNNCPEMCCRPDNCKYTHHENILEITHIINYITKKWFDLLCRDK